jgi:hypothetical protein
MLRLFLVTIFIVFSACIAAAQVAGDPVANVSTSSYRPGEPLELHVELALTASIGRIELAYRPYGRSEFLRSEMSLSGMSASMLLPAGDMIPPYIDYFFVLYDHNGDSIGTSPIVNPTVQPYKLMLEAEVRAQAPSGFLTILSPEPDERLMAEDVLISFSLIDPDTSLIDPATTRILLNGIDVSGHAVVSGNLFVVRPENASVSLQPGIPHTIRVEIDGRDGKLFHSYAWNFTVMGRTARPVEPIMAESWAYRSNLQLETRSESVADRVTPYNRASLGATGRYKQFRIDGRIYATNEEKDFRQPQNRFFVGAESPWLSVGYGDSYPIFPALFMSGRRVRGLSSSLTLGFLNVDLASGDMMRGIDGEPVRIFDAAKLDSVQNDSSRTDRTGMFGPYDANRWAEYRYGTFSRNVLAVRPSFGSRTGSHVGFTYLKSKDDLHSIRFGFQPKENVVMGSDILIALDNRNIELSGQVAFSATNRDITTGTFSDAQIDSIFDNETEQTRRDIRRARDILSKFMTVNEHLIPLSLKNLSTLAYEGALSLTYFGNLLRTSYIRRGNDFESFGQPFLRRDVAGYAITDQLRLFDSRLFLNGGLERLEDNTAQTKSATTVSTTANAGFSYLPVTNIPSIAVNYFRSANDNSRRDSIYAVNDVMHRIAVQVGHIVDLFGTRHSLGLSVGTSSRDDATVRNLDASSVSVTLGASTSYGIPLQTSFQVSVNSNSFALPNPTGGQSTRNIDYQTLFASARYRFLEGRLLVNGAINPTFGDIKRTLLDTGAQYFFLPNLSLQTQMSIYLNNQTSNDVVWSVILRADV